MDIEIAKVISKKLITTKFNLDYSIDNVDKEAIETVLSELEKKEAIINEMAKTINKEYYKDIIENYTKKVEKEGIKE